MKVTFFWHLALLAVSVFAVSAGAAEVEFPAGECFSDSLLADGTFNPDYKALQFKEVDGVKTACIDAMSRVRTQTLEIPADVKVDIVNINREFPADAYSTIVLPFDVEQGCIEDGVSFFQIAYIQNNNTYDPKGDWGVYISQPMQYVGLEAGKPYIVRAPQGGNIKFKRNGYSKPCDYVLNTSAGERKTIFSANMSGAESGLPGVWEFNALYSLKTLKETDSDFGKIYGFAAKAVDGAKVGEFVKGGDGAYILPMRAYLKYNSAGELPADAKGLKKQADQEEVSADVLPNSISVYLIENNESEGEHTTFIGHMNAATGDIVMDKDLWYDMKGRSYDRKPSIKGTYYNKGNKIIIK